MSIVVAGQKTLDICEANTELVKSKCIYSTRIGKEAKVVGMSDHTTSFDNESCCDVVRTVFAEHIRTAVSSVEEMSSTEAILSI